MSDRVNNDLCLGGLLEYEVGVLWGGHPMDRGIVGAPTHIRIQHQKIDDCLKASLNPTARLGVNARRRNRESRSGRQEPAGCSEASQTVFGPHRPHLLVGRKLAALG